MWQEIFGERKFLLVSNVSDFSFEIDLRLYTVYNNNYGVRIAAYFYIDI